MPDAETFIVKGGIIVLASLAVLRLIVHEIRNLKDDLTGKRRRR
jgi:hypothetical protein